MPTVEDVIEQKLRLVVERLRRRGRALRDDGISRGVVGTPLITQGNALLDVADEIEQVVGRG